MGRKPIQRVRQAQRRDGGKGVSSPHLVEEKETQGDNDAPADGIPSGKAFHDPVKCGRATGFYEKFHALIRTVTR